MVDWEGQLDPTCQTRFYLKIRQVPIELPYPAGPIRLHECAASVPFADADSIHNEYSHFLELTGLRGGDGMVALGTALHTILLWCDTSIDPGPRVSRDAAGTSIFDRRSDFIAHWGHYHDSLPAAALDAMDNHGPVVHQLCGGEAFNPFANAFRLYTAGLRMIPSDVALVSFVSALEGLFTTASENISYRLALAIASLLGQTKEERRAVMDQAKRVYTTRSKTVHGAAITGDLERAAISLSEGLTPEAEELCRRVFRRLLELGLGHFVKNDRKGKRDAFFTLLALGYTLPEAVAEMNIPITAG